MMATTHALWGMAVALPVLAIAPEFAPAAFVAGVVGGLAPDFDLYAGHRKTLHYPVYASLSTVPALALALAVPSSVTVVLAVFLAAAAIHAVTDVLGGGLELRPWEATSERGVYSHYHDRWLPPRRWVRYDGAPEDLLLAGLAALALSVGTSGAVTAVALVLFTVSAVYVLLRKSLASVAERLAALVPASLRHHVPARYRT
ncbi:metal-dependent hydrolase [Natronorubrum aibiense]|uniref:Metal-dependent hydrolase n=1 Tax=Natronorubrum aibiense TaxID=348826 RepID=A0A5P9P4M8_9EURY|nr:metal-dependent hydrolase [Natronorubrum aibiense]QFU83111.1 metal-dependent hydrolase [Natronorubrum aibiense]